MTGHDQESRRGEGEALPSTPLGLSSEGYQSARDFSEHSMHVMHVIDSLSVGGAERMLVEIANRTVKDGHRVAVCVTRDGTALAADLRPEVRLIVLRRKTRCDMGPLIRLARIISLWQVDVLHAHGRSTFSLLALARTIGLLRLPIILHDHFGVVEIDTSTPAWFRLWGKHQLSHYVGVYARLAEWAIRAGVPRGRVVVIENARSLERMRRAEPVDIREMYGISDEELIGVAVCGLREEKGIDVLLDAVARLANTRPVSIIVIGGERDQAYARACYQRCADLGLSDRVRFVGEHRNVPGLLPGADFALMPSRSESGPLVLIEYAMCGLPFVSTRVGSIATRMAGLGLPGFVEPNDPVAFAEAIVQLVNLSPQARRQRGELGKIVAQRLFDIDVVIEDWYKVYQHAAGGAHI